MAGCGGGGETTPDEGLTFSGTVVDFVPSGPGTPVPAMEICISGADVLCETTDDNGAFAFSALPRNTEVAVNYVKAGYVNWQVLLRLGEDDVEFHQRSLSDAMAAVMADLVGAVWPDETTGWLIFLAHDDEGHPIGDVNASLATASGFEPVYLDDMEIPDPEISATTSSGFGTFANVEPGEHAITFTHPTLDCSSRDLVGWDSDRPGAVRSPVVAGLVTEVHARCSDR